jgi:hypothetical protein
MFIEVVIENEIINRVHVDLGDVDLFNSKEFKIREQLIRAYISELKTIFPKADFQLAFESKIHLIELND